MEARKIDLVLSGDSVMVPTEGVGTPKSSAHKAQDAKPGRSRQPKEASGKSRYELDTGAKPQQQDRQPSNNRNSAKRRSKK
jgi:ribonuclease R